MPPRYDQPARKVDISTRERLVTWKAKPSRFHGKVSSKPEHAADFDRRQFAKFTPPSQYVTCYGSALDFVPRVFVVSIGRSARLGTRLIEFAGAEKLQDLSSSSLSSPAGMERKYTGLHDNDCGYDQMAPAAARSVIPTLPASIMRRLSKPAKETVLMRGVLLPTTCRGRPSSPAGQLSRRSSPTQ